MRFGLLFGLLAIGCLACAMRELHAQSFNAMVAMVCAVGMILSGFAHYALFKPLRETESASDRGVRDRKAV